MLGSAGWAAIALLLAGCSSGPSAQQAEATASQARAAVAREYWDVYSAIEPTIQTRISDQAYGGFGACAKADDLVYFIKTLVFAQNETANDVAAGDAAYLNQLEPVLRSHGWGPWQAKSSMRVGLALGPTPGAVSHSRGYGLYLQASTQASGGVLDLLVSGPCVDVGAAEASALVTATYNGREDNYSGNSTSPPRLSSAFHLSAP
jgi:hypothetical protein